MRRFLPFWLIISLFFLAGCSLVEQLSGDTAVSPTATPTTPPPTPTPQSGSTPDPAAAETVTDTTTTLTVWIAPEVYSATQAGTAILQDQLQSFQNTHPDIRLVYEPKAVSGQGSILNYLRVGKNVAPDILPDVVAIPAEQLDTGFNEGLLYPLNGLLPTNQLEDLYPAALHIAIRDESVRGYPFILTSLPHLAYNTDVYTATVPTRWSEFIELPEQHFAFPANGSAGATLALELYLAAGGTLTNEAGQPQLQLEPLVTALEQLENGRSNEFILTQSSNLVTQQDTWRLLENNTASFIQTSANQFLAENDGVLSLSYQGIPGFEHSLIPLVNGWAWAVSTTDSTKQQLAAELIQLLTEPANLGAWSAASNQLPSRSSALATWPVDDSYVAFSQQQLQIAQLHPLPASGKIMTALGNAVFDVISLTQTPQAAAEEAILAIQE